MSTSITNLIYNDEKILALLNCIKLPDADHDIRWRVGAILKNANYKFDIYNQWFHNQKDDKSDKDLEYEWKSFKQYKYSMGTLIWMAKQNNLDKFNEWLDKYSLGKLINLFYTLDNHDTTSDYFYKYNKNLCYYKENDNVWYILDINNRWARRNRPSRLSKKIPKFFYSEFDKLEEYYQKEIIQREDELKIINDQKRIDEKTIIFVSAEDESVTIY